MNAYNFSRWFWDYAFDNPTKIKPTHVAIYFFAVEHCNRLGWKKYFGLPTSMVLDAIGVRSYSVYKKAFDELIEYGFFEIIEYSKNQYSSNVIALKENDKANDKANGKANGKANSKALDKALLKHKAKHLQSTDKSTDSIDKQGTIKTTKTNTPLWRTDYEVYLRDAKIEFQKAVDDKNFIDELKYYYPNLDIVKTINNSWVLFWGNERGWKHKKKSKSENLDWRLTIRNAITLPSNKVFYTKQELAEMERK